MTRPAPRFSDFLEASCGTFHLSVVGPLHILALSQSSIRAIEVWMRNADRKRPGKRPLCLCCNTELAGSSAKGVMPAAFAVAEPFAAKSATVVISGLCKSCFFSGDMKERVIAVWRTVLPDLREIEGGRA
jgi:hypothetical protein